MDESTFDAIVAGFYKAATGEIDWSSALNSVRKSFQSHVAVLHTTDLQTGQLLSIHHSGPGVDDGSFEYLKEYHLIDPRRERVLAGFPGNIGAWWHCHEHFDDAFVASSRNRPAKACCVLSWRQASLHQSKQGIEMR